MLFTYVESESVFEWKDTQRASIKAMLNQKLNDRNEIPVKAQSTEEIFHAALALSPEERVSYLAQVCEGKFFRLAVELLIESHEETSNFVDVPGFQAAAEILMEGKQLKEGQMVAHYRCFFAGPGAAWAKFTLPRIPSYIAKYRLSFSTNLAHDRERMRRFEQEARPISALNHPNTFTIHEISEVDGQTLSLLSSSGDKHFGTIEVGH